MDMLETRGEIVKWSTLASVTTQNHGDEGRHATGRCSYGDTICTAETTGKISSPILDASNA